MTAVSDNFDRADTSTLTGYTELVGDWEIVSNKLQCNNDAGSTGYYLRNDTSVGSNDMYAQAVTSSAQSNSSSNTGVLCRGQTGATNTSYQLATNHGADTWAIWRITAGSETQLLTGSAPIASGDTIRLEAAGSILRAKINGTLVGLVRDTTTSGGMRGGLNGYNAVGSDVVEIDNFETGALTDSPPGGPYVNGWSAQSSGTGTTQAPGVPANSIADGVCVLAWITSKDASQTVTAPAGEGWVLVENPSQTGLEGYLFAKIWGLAGQTDSSTPTFSIGSGTAGWLTTLQLVRNPAHDTAPWTSVASAIVASGSSSNAAASTVSAPSVTVSGSHLTVDRFYGSADDNALGGTISAGAGVLSFNGAAYDQTTGGGIAQASTVLEDTTIGSSTGTATVTETVAGNDISNGVTLVFAIPSAGVDASAGNASGSGAANQPGISASTTSGSPSGAGTAPSPTANVGAHPAAPVGAGVANPATILTGAAPEPGSPLAAGTANTPVVSVAVNAGLAAGTATAAGPAPSVAPGAGLPAGAGSAPEAAAQTGSFVNAAAGLAAAAGQAFAPSGLVAPAAGVALGAGSVSPPRPLLAVGAGAAEASGVAAGASGAITKLVFAGAAEASAAALPVRALVAVGAGAATGHGSAPSPAVDASVPFVDPNPTVARVRESRPSLTDSGVQRLREDR